MARTAEASSDFAVLPGGQAAVAGGLVTASARGRLLEAIAQAVATKGYTATTVGDVVSRAGMSRKTFYDHFSDKEDCFLAACTYVADTLHDACGHALDAAPTPRERIELLVRTYLRALRASPRGAIAFIIEARAATPRVREHHRRILERFADLARFPAASDDSDADRLFRLASVIVVEDLAAREIAEGRADQLIDLEDTFVELATRMAGLTSSEPSSERRQR
jgi:AcrR family transcriptional regulator